jgi:hypothetical protein
VLHPAVLADHPAVIVVLARCCVLRCMRQPLGKHDNKMTASSVSRQPKAAVPVINDMFCSKSHLAVQLLLAVILQAATSFLPSTSSYQAWCRCSAPVMLSSTALLPSTAAAARTGGMLCMVWRVEKCG